MCRKADIHEITVTGGYKHLDLLERVKPRIVLVEVAAEILEAHFKLVMIGDHMQAEAVPSWESLCFSSLRVQHRMAPAIIAYLGSGDPLRLLRLARPGEGTSGTREAGH